MISKSSSSPPVLRERKISIPYAVRAPVKITGCGEEVGMHQNAGLKKNKNRYCAKLCAVHHSCWIDEQWHKKSLFTEDLLHNRQFTKFHIVKFPCSSLRKLLRKINHLSKVLQKIWTASHKCLVTEFQFLTSKLQVHRASQTQAGIWVLPWGKPEQGKDPGKLPEAEGMSSAINMIEIP